MRSARYQKKLVLIDRSKAYPLEDAVALMKQTSVSRFDGAVELHVRLGINTKQSDQQVRGSVVLPHGTGRSIRIAVFTTPSHEAQAREAGADCVGGDELIQKVKETGTCDTDIVLATPDIMKNLAVVAKILGPKGLMPTPKNSTVVTNVAGAIAELKRGKVMFKNDDGGNVHATVGKCSWENQTLIANIKAFLEALTKAKPASAKGAFLRSVTLASTMGPGIRLSV